MEKIDAWHSPSFQSCSLVDTERLASSSHNFFGRCSSQVHAMTTSKVEARKRRTQKLQAVPKKTTVSVDEDDFLRGFKQHSRYVPGVPMSREELSAWRKEARRIRNRESAAASREKTRQRIEELEGQLQEMQAKYKAAMQRIAKLEGSSPVSSLELSTSLVTVSPENSPPNVHVSPETTPEALSLDADWNENNSEDDCHHSQSMISTTAV